MLDNLIGVVVRSLASACNRSIIIIFDYCWSISSLRRSVLNFLTVDINGGSSRSLLDCINVQYTFFLFLVCASFRARDGSLTRPSQVNVQLEGGGCVEDLCKSGVERQKSLSMTAVELGLLVYGDILRDKNLYRTCI